MIIGKHATVRVTTERGVRTEEARITHCAESLTGYTVRLENDTQVFIRAWEDISDRVHSVPTHT